MPKPRKPVPSYLPRTEPLAPQPEPAATPPPFPATVKMIASVSRLLCPACRHTISTYSSRTVGTVTIRYHRCRHCGATRIRTHETDGKIAFVGWARFNFPKFSRN